MTFATLDRDWTGRTVYLIGGGPSLKGFDFDLLRGRGIVVAINDAVLALPWADAVFTVDTVWLSRRRDALRDFAGERIAAVPPDWPTKEWQEWRCLLRIGRPGGSSANRILTGHNSGFGALGMTLVRGASRVGLLGYDMTAPGHWHQGYNWFCRFGFRDFPRWRALFPMLAEVARRQGAEVINCNPLSGVRCFRFADWDAIAEGGEPCRSRSQLSI